MTSDDFDRMRVNKAVSLTARLEAVRAEMAAFSDTDAIVASTLAQMVSGAMAAIAQTPSKSHSKALKHFLLKSPLAIANIANVMKEEEERNAMFSNFASVSLDGENTSVWIGFPPASGGFLIADVLNAYFKKVSGDKISKIIIDGGLPHHRTRLKDVVPGCRTHHLVWGHQRVEDCSMLHIDAFKKILLVREIYNASFSSARHHYGFFGIDPKKDGGFVDERLVECLMKITHLFIDWYNSWGEYMERHGNSLIHVVRFEDMKTIPLETFSSILRFIGVYDIDVEALQSSIDVGSLSGQRAISNYKIEFGQDRFGYRGALDYGNEIGPLIRRCVSEHIVRKIKWWNCYPYDRPL
ncbi:hypothetical protein CCP2SC5_340009 [Azospirillaceae bacterium]